jgi:hypothetical protein
MQSVDCDAGVKEGRKLFGVTQVVRGIFYHWQRLCEKRIVFFC